VALACDIDQLRGDAQAIAGLAHTALEDRPDPQLAADLGDALASRLLLHDREVRAITVRSCSRDSFEISSSVMPSEKYSSSGSALMLANGSTAMRFC
jgi:hypothetical protein